MLVRPLLIGLRELRSWVADIGALGFSLALPLVLLALMIGAFGSEVTFSGTAYIVDNDGGAYSAALLDNLRAVDGLSVEVLAEDEAIDRIERSAILMYFEIPPGFSESVDAGQPLDVRQHQRGGGGQEGQIVSSIVRSTLEELSTANELHAGIASILAELGVEATDEQIDAHVGQAEASIRSNPPVEVAMVRPDGDEPNSIAAALFPRIAGWMVLFAVALSAQAFVIERQEGTLERLLTTRLTLNELFIGKWVANILRGLAQFIILFVIGGLVFDFFTVGSWLNAVLFGVVVVAAVSSLGLLIASIAKTEAQATWGAVFFTMGMAVLGGTFFETGADEIFGIVSKFTVTFWMHEGFDRLVINGGSLGDVTTEILVMIAITVAGLALSRMLFKPVEGVG